MSLCTREGGPPSVTHFDDRDIGVGVYSGLATCIEPSHHDCSYDGLLETHYGIFAVYGAFPPPLAVAEIDSPF